MFAECSALSNASLASSEASLATRRTSPCQIFCVVGSIGGGADHGAPAWREVVVSATPAMDHIGIGVPELATAKEFYDDFMPVVGFKEWFPADDHQFNYGPAGNAGTQLFFYRATQTDAYSRHGTGLQHLAFAVASRSTVERAHLWAVQHSCDVVHEPKEFPEYGEGTYATYFLDRHGIMIEVVSHANG